MDITNHINVDRTLKELGVDIFKLKPNSEKRVFKICEICKKEELKKYRYIATLKQTKCINCSNVLNGRNNKDKISATNKKYFETHVHPRLGVKHTEEARKKIVENRKPYTATEETRRKLSEANSGTRNGFYGKKHSEKTLEKILSMRLFFDSKEVQLVVQEAMSEVKKSKMSVNRVALKFVDRSKQKYTVIVEEEPDIRELQERIMRERLLRGDMVDENTQENFR